LRKIFCLLLVALWGLTLVGCATGSQNHPTQNPGKNGQLAWLEELNIPEDKLEDLGEIKQAWELNEDLILINHIRNMDWTAFAVEDQEMMPKYIVSFKQIEQAEGDLYELDDEKLQGLNPAEVMELYWQARQQRNLELLRVLLIDDTGVATLEETLVETTKEWGQGYWMVIDYAVGEYTINRETAIVQVSAKLTRPDGRLFVQENVPYGMTRQDGVWKVNIMATQ